MNKEIIAKGIVSENGELKIYSKEYFVGQIKNQFKGKRIKYVVSEDKPKASGGQKSYYFGIMLEMIQNHYKEGGVKRSKEQIDYDLRMNFLYIEDLDIVTGEFKRRPMSLKESDGEVDTKRMMEYWEDIEQWSSEELDLVIPDPDSRLRKK